VTRNAELLTVSRIDVAKCEYRPNCRKIAAKQLTLTSVLSCCPCLLFVIHIYTNSINKQWHNIFTFITHNSYMFRSHILAIFREMRVLVIHNWYTIPKKNPITGLDRP